MKKIILFIVFIVSITSLQAFDEVALKFSSGHIIQNFEYKNDQKRFLREPTGAVFIVATPKDFGNYDECYADITSTTNDITELVCFSKDGLFTGKPIRHFFNKLPSNDDKYYKYYSKIFKISLQNKRVGVGTAELSYEGYNFIKSQPTQDQLVIYKTIKAIHRLVYEVHGEGLKQ